MIINKISKDIYKKFFITKTNSQTENNNKNNIDKSKEQRTFWESIQKLRPLVK